MKSFIVLMIIVFWIIRKSSWSDELWGSFPIVHGAYYTTYFEDNTIK